jgi:hypothetical protein
MRDPRQDSPDELDAMLAAGAFADEESGWLDEIEDQYAEYRMRKIAEQFGEEF